MSPTMKERLATIEATVPGLGEELKDMRRSIRWLVRAVFVLALTVGGDKALSLLGESPAAASPAPSFELGGEPE